MHLDELVYTPITFKERPDRQELLTSTRMDEQEEIVQLIMSTTQEILIESANFFLPFQYLFPIDFLSLLIHRIFFPRVCIS
jgi:hypothetical protein